MIDAFGVDRPDLVTKAFTERQKRTGGAALMGAGAAGIGAGLGHHAIGTTHAIGALGTGLAQAGASPAGARKLRAARTAHIAQAARSGRAGNRALIAGAAAGGAGAALAHYRRK